MISGVTSAGTLSFGLPDLSLTVNPAITIDLNVGTQYNGQTLKIYRKDAGGSWTDTSATCLVANGTCEFTTTHLSSFLAGETYSWHYGSWGSCSGGTQTRTATCKNSNNVPVAISFCSGSAAITSQSCSSGGGGGGGGAIINNCTTVVYGNWGACLNGFQFRSVLSKAPAGCSLTTTQQIEAQRACVLGKEPVITPPATTPVSPVNVAVVMANEKALVTKVNTALTNRLAGRILLQVEEKGQAWYVEPVTKQKYFMGRPADAFNMMRRFGLGISEANFSKFEKSGVPVRFAGRIFLRVENKGEAYYVNPTDMKLYYLGRPADAFNLMKKLALGISNSNIRQIPVGEVK